MSDIKIVPEMLDYELHDFLFAVTAMCWCHLTKTEIIGSKADLVWDRIIFEGVTKAVYLVSKQISWTIKNW